MTQKSTISSTHKRPKHSMLMLTTLAREVFGPGKPSQHTKLTEVGETLQRTADNKVELAIVDSEDLECRNDFGNLIEIEIP